MATIFRSASRRTGWTSATQQDRWYRYGGSNYATSNTGSGKKVFEYATGDYNADATVTGANYRIDVEHDLFSTDYMWDVFKTEDGGYINVVKWWRGEYILKLWFVANTKDIKVIIDP